MVRKRPDSKAWIVYLNDGERCARVNRYEDVTKALGAAGPMTAVGRLLRRVGRLLRFAATGHRAILPVPCGTAQGPPRSYKHSTACQK
jgi:hypothetical protein